MRLPDEAPYFSAPAGSDTIIPVRPPDIINLTAKEAFDRLSEFLDALGIAVESEGDSVEPNDELELPRGGTE